MNMTMSTFQWYHNLPLLIGLVAFAGIVLVFGSFAPWYKSKEGIALFGMKVNMFLILLLIFISRISGGDYPGSDIIRGVVYWTTAINAIALFLVIVNAQVLGHRRRQKARREAEEELAAFQQLDDESSLIDKQRELLITPTRKEE